VISKPLILLIKIYQYTLSPILGKNCRFNPSCSNYTAQSIQRHGAFTGLWLSIKRISRCNPWGGQGYDPVKE